MADSITITIDIAETSRYLDGVQQRMDAPFSGPLGTQILDDMRYGPESIDEAFATGTEFSLGGNAPWPITQPFGSYTPGESGSLRSAWLGGLGNIEVITGNSVFNGVDTSSHPEAGVFQAEGPTAIVPKNRGKGGRLKMQVYLGLTYEVWLTAARLLQGLHVYPRRIGIGEKMVERMVSHCQEWVVEGKLGGVAGGGAV